MGGAVNHPTAATTRVAKSTGDRAGPGPRGVDPATALAPLAQALSADGYRLEVSVRRPRDGTAVATVRLRVVPTGGACGECLVPEPTLAGIVGDALGPGWEIELSYPEAP